VSEFARALTPLNATAMVAGTIIGASIFVQPSEIARHLDTPMAIMTAWLACGVLTLFGAFVCAELASAFPQTGGMYVFLRETFSPLTGFLWGWAMFWSVHSGIIAAIAVVFGRYASVFLPQGLQTDANVRILAIAVILVLSAINYIGVRSGSRVQTTLTLVKVAAILALVVGGFLFASPTGASLPSASAEGDGFTRFVLAMVAGLFAYGGWHMVTYTAGETTMPAV
jgi:basic amino acid/polyamine antiporter, APA family